MRRVSTVGWLLATQGSLHTYKAIHKDRVLCVHDTHDISYTEVFGPLNHILWPCGLQTHYSLPELEDV